MKLKELYEKQRKLDQLIADNLTDGTVDGDDKMFLSDRIMALSVEVGELANATRCFKYWSQKEAESKERQLDEYADVLHFFLSVGNTLGFTVSEVEEAYKKKYQENIRRQTEGY